MIAYLLKSATCLGLLLAFYHLVLEKEKMHSFNRFYLLGSILFSFLAPLYVIYIDVEPIIIEQLATPDTIYTTENITSKVIVEESTNYTFIIMWIYCLISSILLLRFGRNLYRIILKAKNSTTIKYLKANLVLVDDKILPHTFWNYIFINKDDYENKNIEKELFTHELTHVTQKHTLDILLLELLQIFFWINPLFIWLKKAIQLNHEFLADENVINQHKNTFQYQYLLLNKAAWKNEYYLASNLNYALTKKRLKMMTTQSSQAKILFKKLAVIPLLTGFLFLFAERVEAQEKVDIIEITEGASSKQIDIDKSKIYKEYVYKNGFIQTKDKNGKKFKKKYTDLTSNEKDKLPPPPPLKNKRKVPTQQLIEDLKDNSKYAIWIDGKAAKNNILNKYKSSDFSNYFVSFVHKNARSKSYPQEQQAHLETKKYFETQNKKRVNDFLKYVKEKHNIEEVEKESKPKAIEIKEKKSDESKPEYIDSPIQKYNYPNGNYSKQSIPTNNNVTDIRKKLQDINALKINYIYKEDINTGFININGSIFYYVTMKDKTKYYNKDGKLCDKNGEQISNKKANASDIIPENYVKRIIYQDAIFCEFIDDKPNTGIPVLDTIPKNNTVSKEKMQEYNSLTLETEKKKIIKVKTVDKLKSIYNSMTNEQQNSVKNIDQVLYKLPPPPKMDTIFTYNRLADRIKRTSKNRKANLIYLNSIYDKMDENQKLMIISPDKVIPEIKKNYKFSIILEKNKEKITMTCKKGCEWQELSFDLKLNTPQIVNKYGLNKVNQRNADDSFYFVLLQDSKVFDLKSTKNTEWKGLSGSSSEKMKLILNPTTVDSVIN